MGQAIGNYINAGKYKSQARVARIEGEAQKSAYERQARNLDDEAKTESHAAARSMMKVSQDESLARAQVRAARGASGFTNDGSGQQAEISIADAFEKSLSDMAFSNRINDYKKRYAANAARHEGDLALLQSEFKASEYERYAKNSKKAALWQLGAGAVGVGAGYLNNMVTPSLVGRVDGNGDAVMNASTGKQYMDANPNRVNPWALGYDVSNATGAGLSFMPGTLPSNNGAESSIWSLFGRLGYGGSR